MQPEARVRIIAWISWLTGRGQQSDSYTYLSSVTRYLPELACLSSFARIFFKRLPPVVARDLPMKIRDVGAYADMVADERAKGSCPEKSPLLHGSDLVEIDLGLYICDRDKINQAPIYFLFASTLSEGTAGPACAESERAH